MSGGEGWAALLRRPGVRGVVLASLLARLPYGTMGLATVLYVQGETGSFAAAGLTVGAFLVASGALAPLRGQLVDRRGMRAALLPMGLLNAAATGGLLVVGALGGGTAAFVAVSALAGATAPPITAAMRALWPRLVGEDDLHAAYALEAVLQETVYLAGPLLVGLLVALFSAAVPIALSVLFSTVGVIFFVRSPVAAQWQPAASSSRSPLRSHGLKAVLATVVAAWVAIGVLEVAVPAFCERHGSVASAGPLLAAISVGSILGGFWYGNRTWRLAPVDRLIAASALAALGYALTIPADSIPLLAIALGLLGLTIAPTLAIIYSMLDGLVSAGTAVESTTWITTATAGGSALGAAFAGLVVESHSTSLAFAGGTAAVALSALIPLLGREMLRGGTR